jgi:hypothetical protein
MPNAITNVSFADGAKDLRRITDIRYVDKAGNKHRASREEIAEAINDGVDFVVADPGQQGPTVETRYENERWLIYSGLDGAMVDRLLSLPPCDQPDGGILGPPLFTS